LSKSLQDFEVRPTQTSMNNLILEAFRENRRFIIEAGTGIGKTLAYLLPSIYLSLILGEKVVVSTYTHNLQGQIMNKDLPLLEKAFSFLNSPIKFKSATLKGRKNYISLKRLENFLDKKFFQDHEVTLLIKILLWLEKTESGDMEELSIQGKEYSVLDEICCAEHVCQHEDPEYLSGCYLMKARKKAEKANIVIVNHALLIQDAIADSQLLPEYRYLVVDEAHHLEKVATDSLTISISFNNFLRPFEKLQTAFPNGTNKAVTESAKELVSIISKIISRIDIFFGLMGIFMEKSLKPRDFQYSLMLTERHYETAAWQKIKTTGQGIGELGNELLKKLGAVEEVNGKRIIKNLAYECEKRLEDLKTAINGENRDHVSWIFKTPEGNIVLKNAPSSIGPKLQEMLFTRKNSVILTSGTLRTDKSFAFIREQLALGEEFEEKYFPSHFSYPDQVKVLLPTDLPEPNTEGYFVNCADLIADVIRKNGGRTLVLFTSKSSLMATYKLLAPQLKEEGYTILGQNITGGRGKILEHFKDEPGNCAIFGTSSFWEGIDIKGNDLNCVILYKLPFDPPEDPIIFTRCRMYKDSFSQFQLPRAILKFKQGFGRLIRSGKDTGSIIVLDPRIVQKNYGPQFIESLPEGIKIEYTSKKHLTDFL
jgi:predicted DnaQ family exonuclease/DinG family helicase